MFHEMVGRKSPYVKVGRMLIQDNRIRVVIDGRMEFWLDIPGLRCMISGFGKALIFNLDNAPIGEAELSESSNGLLMRVGEEVFVSPISRVKAVISGQHRKAPVFV